MEISVFDRAKHHLQTQECDQDAHIEAAKKRLAKVEHTLTSAGFGAIFELPILIDLDADVLPASCLEPLIVVV